MKEIRTSCETKEEILKVLKEVKHHIKTEIASARHSSNVSNNS